MLLFADQNKIIAGTTPILAARIKKNTFLQKNTTFLLNNTAFLLKNTSWLVKHMFFLLFELHSQGTAPSKSPLVPFAPSAPAPKAARRWARRSRSEGLRIFEDYFFVKKCILEFFRFCYFVGISSATVGSYAPNMRITILLFGHEEVGIYS